MDVVNQDSQGVPVSKHPRRWLSICIPTFNRSEKIDRLLASIDQEQRRSGLTVEITISDNASSDNTPEIVKKWIVAGLVIRYRKNIKNLGPDLNMKQCFDMASGQFKWWIGDDDRLLPGSLIKLQGYLNTPNIIAVVSSVPTATGAKSNSMEMLMSDAKTFLLNGGIGFPFGTLIVKNEIDSDSLRLDHAIGTYHYYAYYFWAVLGDLVSRSIPLSIKRCGPLLVWDVSPNKWYKPKLWEVYYRRTIPFLNSFHPCFDEIKPQLLRQFYRNLSSLDTPYDCLASADSKIDCIRAMATFPMPLVYKLRLCVFLIIRFMGVHVNRMLRATGLRRRLN